RDLERLEMPDQMLLFADQLPAAIIGGHLVADVDAGIGSQEAEMVRDAHRRAKLRIVPIELKHTLTGRRGKDARTPLFQAHMNVIYLSPDAADRSRDDIEIRQAHGAPNISPNAAFTYRLRKSGLNGASVK